MKRDKDADVESKKITKIDEIILFFMKNPYKREKGAKKFMAIQKDPLIYKNDQ